MTFISSRLLLDWFTDGKRRMKKTLAVALAVMALAACKPNEKDFISHGESLLKESLKDPDSAKIESFYHPSGDNDGYVCGEVNAKNSYGGYTGKKPFYIYIELNDGKVKSHGPVTIVADDDNNTMEKFKLFCL